MKTYATSCCAQTPRASHPADLSACDQRSAQRLPASSQPPLTGCIPASPTPLARRAYCLTATPPDQPAALPPSSFCTSYTQNTHVRCSMQHKLCGPHSSRCSHLAHAALSLLMPLPCNSVRCAAMPLPCNSVTAPQNWCREHTALHSFPHTKRQLKEAAHLLPTGLCTAS